MESLLRRGFMVFLLGALLAAQVGCGDDTAGECAPPDPADPRMFVDRTDDFGITFTHHPSTPLCHITDTVGGPGVCMFDFDGDSDLDLYFVDRDPNPSALYRNDGGTFVDVANTAGVDRPGDAIGCLAFDYDGDSDLDLLVTTTGQDKLYRNDGGTFSDVSVETGIAAQSGFSTSATAADIDADGDLDLFVAQLVDLTTCPAQCNLFPLACQSSGNLLYVNNGGSFTEAAAQRGLIQLEPSLVSLFFDEDGDGDVDLYVGNDMGVAFPDRLYQNDGNGFFSDAGGPRGYSAAGSDTMGVDVGDYNGDGRTDMITSDFKDRPTHLYDCFDPALSCSFGSMPPETTASVNWSVGFVDVDNDGDLDVFQTSGDVYDPDLVGSENQLFLNDGAGRFSLFVPPNGSGLGKKAVHRGAVFGDFDNDGDVDIVVATNGGKPEVLENVGASGHSVRVELPTHRAGARVTAKFAGRSLTEHVLIGGGYLGSSDPRLTFGIGAACSAEVRVEGQAQGARQVDAGSSARFE